MDVDFTIALLGTAVGCGTVTAALLQVVLKPILKRFEGVPSFEQWRGVVINLSALIVSITLAILAALVFDVTYETVLQAFLTGLGGALVATAIFEGLKNFGTAFGFRVPKE